MIVNQFSTFPYGGAAAAAKRLHHQLRRDGIDSRFYYHRCEKTPPNDDSFHQLEFETPRKNGLSSLFAKHIAKKRRRHIYRQYNKHIANRKPNGEVFAMAELPEPTRIPWNQIGGDIVHLHWMSFFADYPSFFESIPENVPIVWTLHDMNPFTGGCHYSTGCEKFTTGCGNCPQIVSPAEQDVSFASFRVKQKSFRNRNLHIVTPSKWLCDLARQSPVWPTGTTFQTVKLGFDLEAFRPIEKLTARQKLNIDTDAVLIGFGAEDIRNQRKGFQHLLAALPLLKTKTPVECVVFGSGEIPADPQLPKMHHFGFVENVEQQRLIYSAADLVVVPSREDNQPQVGLEAMACGTPVVGFNAGGIAEYVREGNTGVLAELGNELELAARISELVDDHLGRKSMGQQARQMTIDEFEISKQTVAYEEIYDKALTTMRQLGAA